MNRIPILIYSDAPSAPSGLARICRDLATRIATKLSDVFEVATIGAYGFGSTKLPFIQYSWQKNDEWIIHELPEVWRDFAGDRKGIFLSIQDPSRMMWFSQPRDFCPNTHLAEFLKTPPFKKWGYFPLDASGPNGKFTLLMKQCFLGYERVLCYSEWAEKIVTNTIGISASDDRNLQAIPHGIDTSIFHARGRKFRQNFGQLSIGQKIPPIKDDESLVGIVATNQVRKDYGLAVEALSLLSKRRKIRLWIHTDALERHWSLPYLLADFGLNTKEISPLVSLSIADDDTMAKLYSACDVTLGIGNAEGFGYPIFESIACGTPCVHGNFGGAPEHMSRAMLVTPVASRMEGSFNAVRMVYRPEDWVERIEYVLENKPECKLAPHLAWDNLWSKWERWLLKGIKSERSRFDRGDDEVARMGRVLDVMAEIRDRAVSDRQQPA